MKVTVRTVQKIATGKMEEFTKFRETLGPVVHRLGAPQSRHYQPLIGEEGMHTIIVENDWDSLADFEAFNDKMSADPEYNELLPRLDEFIESRIRTIYISVS